MSPRSTDRPDESWFSRWRRCRDEDPDSPLEVLLRARSHGRDVPSSSELIDIACMDLMQQRRNGREVRVEDYLRAFPTLDNESQRLDLMDAEMCICHELGCPQTIRQWTERFPRDADAIASLLRLDAWAVQPKVVDHDSSVENVTLIESSAMEVEFSLDAGRSDDLSTRSLPEAIPDNARPIAPSATPDWFVGQKVFASGPGWWIVRGVHRDSHATYALKIISLPSTISSSQVRRLSEVVGQCARADHPNWVVAESSTVYDGHLGVLRPWVHGVAWHEQLGEIQTVVRRLAVVAMMVAGGAAVGRNHGGVHAGNLWIDHQGQVKLIDAGSSRRGIRQWLTGGSGEFMDGRERDAWDCEELKWLVASTLMRSQAPLADAILQRIRDPQWTPLRLAEFLLDAADGKPLPTMAKSTNVRARLTRWLRRGERRAN